MLIVEKHSRKAQRAAGFGSGLEAVFFGVGRRSRQAAQQQTIEEIVSGILYHLIISFMIGVFILKSLIIPLILLMCI